MLPSPRSVVSALVSIFGSAESWISVLTSARRVLISVVAALFLAALLSWLAAKYPSINLFLAPSVLLIKAVPIVSFILIALFFMKEAVLTSFICGLIVFPLIYGQLLSAFLNVDRSLLEMGRVFSLNKREVICYIVVPEIQEPFLAATSVAVGMAWKAGVAAEVLAYAKGTIGRHMHEAKLYLDMEGLLAWTIVLVLAAFLTEHLLMLFLRLALTAISEKLPAEHRLIKLLQRKSQHQLKTRSKLLEQKEFVYPTEKIDESHPCLDADGPVLVSGILHKAAPEEDSSIPNIEIENLSKCYNTAYIFKDFNVSIPIDRPLALIGSSGVGKTTLMKMIAGLLPQDKGSIRGVPERGVFVFQENRLLRQLSARDNIRLVLPDYDNDRAAFLLDKLNLSSVADNKAGTLSGGEQRRLALARALAPESDIIYLDEAFRELDEKHETEALQLMLQLVEDKAVIVATHDLSSIDRMKANILELKRNSL